ncbi:unnamed protein product, partial [Polarella glacialis]
WTLKVLRQQLRCKQNLMRTGLTKYNDETCVRKGEVVSVETGAAGRIKGKGAYKKWTASAMLRVSLGHATMSAIKSKLMRKSPVMFSLNSLPFWTHGSVSHIARAMAVA